MKALAGKFYGQIKTSVLDKGATHVVLLNMPGITNTPRFQMVLTASRPPLRRAPAQGASDTVAAAAGAKARDDAEALFKSWISAFNAELASKVGRR